MTATDFLKAISFHTAIHDVEVYGLIMLDLECRVVTWNRGATQLLGFNESEVLGQHFEFFFTAEDRALGIPQKEKDSALGTGYAYDDRWHVRKDQSQIFVNGGLCLLKNDAGQPLGFVKIIRDQTERKNNLDKIKELNEQLVQAHAQLENYTATLEEKIQERTMEVNDRNAELQDFCYSIAHDVRAPLRSMQAMSQVVIEDYGTILDTTGKEYLGRIVRAGEQLDRLTLDLLDYTRCSREEIHVTSISLEKVIDDVLYNLGENIAQKNATVSVHKPLPLVKGQHAYAMQIFGNFISNALKFVLPTKPPLIEIWAEATAKRVRVYVKDNGIGVPTEHQAKIFFLFERLHPQGSFEGTGVGLAIARKAAQRMKGEVGIIPGVNEGSIFWLDLEPAV
jgi:PAS domain S-box-containing protein